MLVLVAPPGRRLVLEVLLVEASVVDEDVPSVGEVEVDSRRLDLDVECRIEGVRRDSLALGSSSVVYRPIEGRWMTCRIMHISFITEPRRIERS